MLKRVKKRIRSLLSRRTVKEPVYIPVVQTKLLEGRSALVTGGSSGIGFSIAKSFLQSGAAVVITGRNASKLDAAVESLKEYGNVKGIVFDISDVANMESSFRSAVELMGSIDIVVNNAGVSAGNHFGKVTEEDFDAVINTNLKGTFFMSQVAANYMRDARIKGNILMIGSSSGLRPAATPYTISKWGVRGLTSGLAKTLLPYGIIVNGLAPGPTATPMLVKDDTKGIALGSSPSGRYSDTEEMANFAVYLVSQAGRQIVGDIIHITGGAGIITYDDMNYSW